MANQQMDNFGKILESHGVIVDRAVPLDFSQEVLTPDWKQGSMLNCMPPRDLLLTVGNEILEGTMTFRSRFFEYLCFRPLIDKYFQEDPNFRHEAAPKPRLTELSYKKDFHQKWPTLSEAEKLVIIEASDWILTEEEPLFDAADVLRCGKDLFVQKSMVTNDLGFRWLRQHFPAHRVHQVRFREVKPWHMDSTMVPIRPGLVMLNPQRPPLVPTLLELLKKNDWEVMYPPKSVLTKARPLSSCSLWLSMNVLMLDTKTVFVEASEIPLQEELDRRGLEVIPVPFYEVSPYGGGLHCATADVYREGNCEDYFPHQIEDF
jgi:glycine amidinotransferase